MSHNPVSIQALDSSVALLTDHNGDQEVVEIDTDIVSGGVTAVSLVGPTSNGMKIVTVGFLDGGSSQATALYVGFTGTPFNDPETAGLRRVVGIGQERTFVFANILPTGIGLTSDVASDSGAQHTYVEVTYV